MVKFLHLCFPAVIFFFNFSDRQSIKIENENNDTKTLTAASYIGLEFINE